MTKYIVEKQMTNSTDGYMAVVIEGEVHLNRTIIKSDIQFFTTEGGYKFNHPYESAERNAQAIAKGLNELNNPASECISKDNIPDVEPIIWYFQKMLKGHEIIDQKNLAVKDLKYEQASILREKEQALMWFPSPDSIKEIISVLSKVLALTGKQASQPLSENDAIKKEIAEITSTPEYQMVQLANWLLKHNVVGTYNDEQMLVWQWRSGVLQNSGELVQLYIDDPHLIDFNEKHKSSNKN